jgi:hypothetical protein
MTRAAFLWSLGSFAAAQRLVIREPGDGYESLCNGRELGQWIGNQQRWKVERGVLTGTSAGKAACALVLGGREFGDFELRFDLRVTHGAGGVRMRGLGALGVELEVGASIVRWIMNGSPFVVASSVQPGEWNAYRVICKGSEFKVFRNERNTAYTIEASHYPRRGMLSLVMPAGAPSSVEFGNIWLKE